MESQIRAAGVPEKQAATARRVFMRSAEQAGFLSANRDRLIRPAVVAANGIGNEDGGGDDKRHDTPDDSPESLIGVKDDLIIALFRELPPKGSKSFPNREAWLKVLSGTFDLLYPGQPATLDLAKPVVDGGDANSQRVMPAGAPSSAPRGDSDPHDG
jgi:hypothetical protein